MTNRFGNAGKRPLTVIALPRRGLSRVEAALYIGVSVTKFDEFVNDGRMPQPKRIDRRRIWDIRALDAYFDVLPAEQGTHVEDDIVSPSSDRAPKASRLSATLDSPETDAYWASKTDAEILSYFIIRDPRKSRKNKASSFPPIPLPKRVEEILRREYERRGFPWED